MNRLGRALLVALALVAPVTAQATLFDFDNAPLHAGFPLDITVGGITAHFTATGQGYSIQEANVLGFTPVGFSGQCVYPNSVYLADLMVAFSQPMTDFSIMFSPEEYGCDTSALLRVTAYMGNTYVGTDTSRAYPPGTWPTGTLTFHSASGFDNVVVHYDSPPPTGGDWGPIFMCDNMNVTALPTASVGGGAPVSLGTAPVVAPNPFVSGTTVRFGMIRGGPVSVAVYDVRGRLVRTLAAGRAYEPGVQSVRWDGRDDSGREVGTGVYLCRVQADARMTAARMLLLRAQ